MENKVSADAIYGRFEELVDTKKMNVEALKEIKHLAYCVCIGAPDEQYAYRHFCEILLKYHRIDLKSLEEQKQDGQTL